MRPPGAHKLVRVARARIRDSVRTANWKEMRREETPATKKSWENEGLDVPGLVVTRPNGERRLFEGSERLQMLNHMVKPRLGPCLRREENG